MEFLTTLWAQFLSTLPLFILILLGYLAVKIGRWQKTVTDSLTKFTFYIAFPIMLFQIMSHFSEQSQIDIKVLFVFFGGSFIVFAFGCLVASKLFKLTGSESTLFAMGGIYTNTVFVGIPIIKMLLGEKAIPIVAIIVIFNALIFWTELYQSIKKRIKKSYYYRYFHWDCRKLYWITYAQIYQSVNKNGQRYDCTTLINCARYGTG